jgi:hypothetical protein
MARISIIGALHGTDPSVGRPPLARPPDGANTAIAIAETTLPPATGRTRQPSLAPRIPPLLAARLPTTSGCQRDLAKNVERKIATKTALNQKPVSNGTLFFYHFCHWTVANKKAAFEFSEFVKIVSAKFACGGHNY